MFANGEIASVGEECIFELVVWRNTRIFPWICYKTELHTNLRRNWSALFRFAAGENVPSEHGNLSGHGVHRGHHVLTKTKVSLCTIWHWSALLRFPTGENVPSGHGNLLGLGVHRACDRRHLTIQDVQGQLTKTMVSLCAVHTLVSPTQVCRGRECPIWTWVPIRTVSKDNLPRQ